MADYLTLLKDWGLSEKEATVYLALLQLGPATVNQVAERADLIRTTTYDILKTLRERGLVGSLVRNKILHFTAEDPQKLISSLDEKKQRIQEVLGNLRKLQTAIPEGPVVELLEGKEGIKSVFNDLLKVRKPIVAFGDVSTLFTLLPFAAQHQVQKRAELGISLKLLTERTPDTLRIIKANDKKALRETRFIPRMKDVPIAQYVYGDNVALLMTDINNPLGLIIRHPTFAKEQRILFDLLWEKANK
ncbi:hypothetical protein HY492_00250 [Candidatus Woesearchaeota archaeon]|nr:hypothetical protein [Candidatus Woesearchaeota archaeon]